MFKDIEPVEWVVYAFIAAVIIRLILKSYYGV